MKDLEISHFWVLMSDILKLDIEETKKRLLNPSFERGIVDGLRGKSGFSPDYTKTIYSEIKKSLLADGVYEPKVCLIAILSHARNYLEQNKQVRACLLVDLIRIHESNSEIIEIAGQIETSVTLKGHLLLSLSFSVMGALTGNKVVNRTELIPDLSLLGLFLMDEALKDMKIRGSVDIVPYIMNGIRDACLLYLGKESATILESGGARLQQILENGRRYSSEITNEDVKYSVDYCCLKYFIEKYSLDQSIVNLQVARITLARSIKTILESLHRTFAI